MIFARKKVGETPLELLDRLRIEQPELAGEKLSYAGRLDPMAEGEMLILVGEENKHRDQFMGFDKEYVATFLIGVSTDTGDALGIITGTDTRPVSVKSITSAMESLLEVRTQTYPWFSGKTVGGVKLFDLFKRGDTDIERPTREVVIREAELLSIVDRLPAEIHAYIEESIGRVQGDFRQAEILKRWKEFFSIQATPLRTFRVRFHVSSGTFIRALADTLPFPAFLLSLERTKIHIEG